MHKTASMISRKFSSLLERYPIRNYHRGQNLIYPGDSSRSVYFIVSGKIKQYAISDEGNEIIVNIFHENTFFPTFLVAKKSEYFFDTLSDAEIRIIPKAAFMEYIKTTPDLLMDILNYMQLINNDAIRRMTHLMASNAYYRLAYELIMECKLYPESSNGRYELGLHEHELASRAGMSRETASRQMKKLKSKGLVSVNHTTVEVLDLQKLTLELDGHI